MTRDELPTGVWTEWVRPWVELSLRLATGNWLDGIPIDRCGTNEDMIAYVEEQAVDRGAL